MNESIWKEEYEKELKSLKYQDPYPINEKEYYDKLKKLYDSFFNKNKKTAIEQAAFDLFGEMRQLTIEEQHDREKMLEEISEPTGLDFSDYIK